MTNQELIILLKELQGLSKESDIVEFKVNNSNPQEIGEYISALANSACWEDKPFGFLVFGVENDTHRLVGTSFNPSEVKIGNEELENWLTHSLNPNIDFKIYEFKYDSMNFVIFKIDAAHNIPVGFKGIEYIRVGSYKKKLDDHQEKERKIWAKGKNITFEKDFALKSVSTDTILSLIDYPAFFELLKLPLPDNKVGILQRLLENRVLERNIDDTYNITNLGAILFAKNLENFEDLTRKAIRVIFYKGNNRAAKEQNETLGVKGYAVGFEGLIKFISDRLPNNEVIGKALRKEVALYPMLAVRELIANAIIHQDFSVSGSSPMIEIFENRIEISNPGKPLIDPLRFVDHSPVSRNEGLARFMRRLRICEERGSGIDKVLTECEIHQLPAPDFQAHDSYTRIILYSLKTLRQMDKTDKIRACYLHACLRYVTGENMTNQSLRDRFGIEKDNYPMASRIISDTITAGLIRGYDPDSNTKKYAKYVPFWV